MASKKDFLEDLKKHSYDMEKFIFTKARFNLFNNVYADQTEDYWREFLSYDSSNKGTVYNIKNWLRYRILGSLNFGDDCDCDKRVFQMYNAVFNVNNSIEKNLEISKKERIFTINGIDLETDTMNSFATLFIQYLRINLDEEKGDWIGDYLNEFNISKPTQFYRDMYFLLNIEEWYDQWGKDEKVVLNEFNRFAQYTHCLANMMLVPNDYNVKRQAITKDFWDLTLQDVQNKYTFKERYDKGFIFVSEHILDKFLLDDWFESTNGSFNEYRVAPLYNGHSLKLKMPNDNAQYLDCVSEINRRIEARADKLARKYSHLNFEF